MPVKEIYIPQASESQALHTLIARCAQATEAGYDAESRVYLSGIFEVLAAERLDPMDAVTGDPGTIQLASAIHADWYR